ncbi:uncharacterized protein [Procambarus clarkii]|uniref:uncharacterized protein n=1 Tax=Procambarus clarkii TaxID=6728 RepID=UPI0037437192
MEFLGTDLDNQPVQDIDAVIASIHTRITEATMANCDLTNTRIIQQYKPTREIKDKMRHYQQECVRRLRTGQPSLHIIQSLRREVLGLTLLHKSHIWGTLVNQVNQYKREPARVWGKIRQLLGSSKTPLSHLNYTYTDDNNEVITTRVEDAHLQANLMGLVWEGIFTENNSQINNDNHRTVNQWVAENVENLASRPLVDTALLDPDHPIHLLTGADRSIKKTRNKAPGLSGITVNQLKCLPLNYLQSLINVFNAILVSGHYPQVFKTAKMIFIPKPCNSKHVPGNYRPISLLESTGKCFEKILSNRINYYMEYHHLYTEKQFGFRNHRSTQHAINIIYEAERRYQETAPDSINSNQRCQQGL